MTLLRMILWGLLFYLVIRTAKNIINLFTSNRNSEKLKSTFKPYKSKYNIRKEDVIDAEYEDLTNRGTDNSKKQS
ncbi:MAG: hypothetical protein AB1432_12700 [Bacteroidota bacterium]